MERDFYDALMGQELSRQECYKVEKRAALDSILKKNGSQVLEEFCEEEKDDEQNSRLVALDLTFCVY